MLWRSSQTTLNGAMASGKNGACVYSIYVWLCIKFIYRRNEREIEQAPEYSGALASFQNDLRFSADLSQAASCDIITTRLQPKHSLTHVRPAWVQIKELIYQQTSLWKTVQFHQFEWFSATTSKKHEKPLQHRFFNKKATSKSSTFVHNNHRKLPWNPDWNRKKETVHVHFLLSTSTTETDK